jgi:hypothetical protein
MIGIGRFLRWLGELVAWKGMWGSWFVGWKKSSIKKRLEINRAL